MFWALRRVATLLSGVMQAADVVAEEDVKVRVRAPEHGPLECRRLTSVFNRMTEKPQRADQ